MDGRRIRTYVNGVLYNDTVNRLPEIEELYISAAVEENTQETIVKVVNLTGEEKAVQLFFEEEKKEAGITELSGHELTAENSLDEPEHVVPKKRIMQVEGKELFYTFPAHSVTVMLLR